MEFYEIEGKSSPDSWSTCDISSQHDISALTSKDTSEKLSRKKLKRDSKMIFSTLKQLATPSTNDLSQLTNSINYVFEDESPDNLCKKLNYKCCAGDKHGSRCMKKWKEIRECLLSQASKSLQEPKLIFSIKKRQSPSFKVLLDKSQPSWIHRLFLQSLLVLGNN